VAKVDEKPECPSWKSADTERLMSAPSLGKQAPLNFSLGNPKQRGGRPKSG